MKTIKFSAFLLLSALFIASCGDGVQEEETAVDTTIAVPVMEEAPPPVVSETGNGTDTPVNMNGGGNNMSSEPANKDGSTVGEPTKDPGKSTEGGHPGRVPDKSSKGSPNM